MNSENADGGEDSKPKRMKLGLIKQELTGLLNPLEDVTLTTAHAQLIYEHTDDLFNVMNIVWAKMVGYKPLWSPAIITASGSEGKVLFVLFIMGQAFADPTSSSENTSPSSDNGNAVQGPLPKWYIEERGLDAAQKAGGHWLPQGVQYAWIPAADLKHWEGPHKEGMISSISKLDARKRKMYGEAIEFGDRMHADAALIPSFVSRDSEYRLCVVKHSESVAADLSLVRPALKLQHLKLFLESNMLELHWRTIAYAREFVRPVHDEFFGGYHLIAAQDWPTDEEVDSGKFAEVLLMYPGQVMTADEAAAMEEEERNGIHVDRNRYVAEIPNTAEILDKSGKINVNSTGKNLFVDGLKYSDPKSSIWAPGPTVNHERTQYCKLEPHHVSGNEAIRGFWLQRKRGEIITKGEPLFWSYDCGVGKFDADYGLDKLGPPVGWISTAELRKRMNKK
jgi:hypothetical protein